MLDLFRQKITVINPQQAFHVVAIELSANEF